MKRFVISILIILFFNTKTIAEKMMYLECNHAEYNYEIVIKIDEKLNRLGFEKKAAPSNLEYLITTNDSDKIIAYSNDFTIEEVFGDNSIYQAVDKIIIDRIYGSAEYTYETITDTRTSNTPSPSLVILENDYWIANDCNVLNNKSKF
ncbi:hypothetical protein [Candidatus Pelagibacter sp.]|uniref:hypothetical protein n=1 Tax=Candidatus Pelagibacter sp. TaxID=2024849 RepID=UPI003F842DF6